MGGSGRARGAYVARWEMADLAGDLPSDKFPEFEIKANSSPNRLSASPAGWVRACVARQRHRVQVIRGSILS